MSGQQRDDVAVGRTSEAEREAQARLRRSRIDFTPVRNGMDYLFSAINYLKASNESGPRDSDSDLKYAVLHLQAATEVLLKARLVREHWSLVFKDPGSATKNRYETGDFESCGIAATIKRLKEIVGLPITDKEADEITKLARTRNALTHFGHNAPAHAVEASAARVLGFLIGFIPGHLQPALSKEMPYVRQTMSKLRSELRDIDALVDDRMKQLSGQLKEHAEYTVYCPDCRQPALVPGTEPSCLFCLQKFGTPAEAALRWGWEVLGDPDHAEWYMDTCSCEAAGHTIVYPIMTVGMDEEDVALCFACRAVFVTPSPYQSSRHSAQ